MKYASPGHHKTFESFRAHLRSIDPAFDADSELHGAAGPLGQALRLGTHTIGNRFAIHPMEGWDACPDGRPSEMTLRRWRNFGRSTAKLVWGGEAFAVRRDGRANANQLYLNPEADVAASLDSLIGAIHAGHREMGAETDDLFVGLQLTHSGRFARPEGDPAPMIAYHHPVLDERHAVSPDTEPLTDGELEAIGERYVESAKIAHEVGFHFVDVKCCHGYLMHEILGAKARPGPYGGSLENRTLLLRRIVEGIRNECPDLEIGVRVSLADVFPHSVNLETGQGEPVGWEKNLPYVFGFGVDEDDPRRFDLEEPMRFLGMLRDLEIQLVNISVGSPYYCPHLQRPAAYPPSDGYLPPDDPLVHVVEHLRVVRAAKASFPELFLVGSGYTYLMDFLANVAQYEIGQGHVDFVGIGRMVLSYPEFPYDVLRGAELARKRICRTFSDCTTGPRNGLPSGCFPLDPHYKNLPAADRLKEIKRATRP